jgi:hypothetical protein
MLIFIIIGLVFVVSTLVTLYLTGVFKSKSSSIHNNSNSNNSGSGSGSNINPITENFITGAWINKDGPDSQWSTDFIKNKMDIIFLASYTPNPYSTLYPCTSNMSLFPNDNTNLINMVNKARQFGKYVLFSIGGSSFGNPEWGGLFHYTLPLPCQCPQNSYWFKCPDTNPISTTITDSTMTGPTTTTSNPDDSCCKPADLAAGTCGGIIEITDPVEGDCCNYNTNPHRCCCGYGNKIVVKNGKQYCVPTNPTSCDIPGLVSKDLTNLNICLNTAKNDPDDPNDAILQCKYQYSSSVLAYADMLVATGADGIDFDFEIATSDGSFSQYLITFARDLKTEMKKRNKPLILTLTVLSGDAYGKANDTKLPSGVISSMYGPLYDILLTNNSPFDYAVPMLYNGGQYKYANPVPSTPGEFYWNGLLNTWANIYLLKGISNTKLLPAFIEYSYLPKRPSFQEDAFECSDLINYIEDYITSPADTAVIPVGVLYFYYTTASSYDMDKLNSNIKKSMDYFKNGTSITC